MILYICAEIAVWSFMYIVNMTTLDSNILENRDTSSLILSIEKYWRNPLDIAHRSSLVGIAQRVSKRFNLLAQIKRLGTRRCLGASVARVSSRAGDERGQMNWSESFADGSFAPAKKGVLCRQDQEGQRHEVDGGGWRPKEALWGTTWTLRHRGKSNSWKRRWLRSLCPVAGKDGRRANPDGSLPTRPITVILCVSGWPSAGLN